MTNPSFQSFPLEFGKLFDDSTNPIFPVSLYCLKDGWPLFTKAGHTYYIFVQQGQIMVSGDEMHLIPQGFYCCVPGAGSTIFGKTDAVAIVIEQQSVKGMFMLGGPIEQTGRLKYIDGCTDSLLIPPVKYGDPCLNHLHFPKNIDQTTHTHPSIRIGLVTRGRGECVTPFGNAPLRPGSAFVIIPANGASMTGVDGHEYPIGSHAFRTTDETMDVIAFHPDSDFGPKDEEHPMINRTFVHGVSAKEIESIRTK